MAESTVEVIVANPARKRRTMARRMTLKQRLHFGTPRQRAAAKAALRSSRSRKRTAAHRRPRTTSRRRHHRRETNPDEIIAMTLGNPARKKGRKKMAATKRRRRRHASNPAGHRRRPRHTAHRVHHRRRTRANPGRRRRVYNRGRRHIRHRNPAGHRWTDIFVLGGGAAVGGALSSAGTQLILGTSNTGAIGYVGNLVSTFVLSWLGGMVTRNKSFPAGILAGGIGALIRRVIADYSLFGGYTASLGMGDYLVSNWVAPQRLASDFRSLSEANMGPFNAQGGWGWQSSAPAISSSGVSTRGMGLEGDPASYGSAGY